MSQQCELVVAIWQWSVYWDLLIMVVQRVSVAYLNISANFVLSEISKQIFEPTCLCWYDMNSINRELIESSFLHWSVIYKVSSFCLYRNVPFGTFEQYESNVFVFCTFGRAKLYFLSSSLRNLQIFLKAPFCNFCKFLVVKLQNATNQAPDRGHFIVVHR